MNFGIYARKSVFSDTSDSIRVQIDLCKDYINRQYAAEQKNIIIYNEDEGFTGANTNRPGYKKMISDIENKRIDAIICYKIDRISRDVKDFSNIFDFMQKHGVSFASVKEQIDTATPLGRAMMYICSVFAQMERETIAERIKDNSLALAKSGKWAGGRPPVGYKLERTIISGKEHSVLIPNQDEIPFLNFIFDSFLEGNTLSGLDTRFRNEGIKTLNGNYLSSTQIYSILTNPSVVQNTDAVWDYFDRKGCIMSAKREDFDGRHGVIVYGRTAGGTVRKHVVNKPDKWLIAVGLHEPIVDASRWLLAQERFGLNKIDKTRKHEIGVLKGIVKCKCGYTMRVQHKVDSKSKKIYDNYFCQNRSRRGIEYCDMKMVNVDTLDNAICDIIQNISVNKDAMGEYIPKKNNIVPVKSKSKILKEITVLESKIAKLTGNLSYNSSSTAAKYLIAEIEKLDSQIAQCQSELRDASIVEADKESVEKNRDIIFSSVCLLAEQFDGLSFSEKNKALKVLLKKCVWNGTKLQIEL